MPTISWVKASCARINEAAKQNHDDLPAPVVVQILSHLDAREAARGGGVSRRWLDASRSPELWAKLGAHTEGMADGALDLPLWTRYPQGYSLVGAPRRSDLIAWAIVLAGHAAAAFWLRSGCVASVAQSVEAGGNDAAARACVDALGVGLMAFGITFPISVACLSAFDGYNHADYMRHLPQRRYAQEVEAWKKAGPDVHAKRLTMYRIDAHGRALAGLHACLTHAYRGHGELERIIATGLRVDAPLYGQTALALAVSNRDIEACRLLLEAGHAIDPAILDQTSVANPCLQMLIQHQ